jgi:hypothetical protein
VFGAERFVEFLNASGAPLFFLEILQCFLVKICAVGW